jgi:hypothetical protein
MPKIICPDFVHDLGADGQFIQQLAVIGPSALTPAGSGPTVALNEGQFSTKG